MTSSRQAQRGRGPSRVTLRDIAAELKISSSTVSRALRGDALISAATQRAVAEAAARLGYATRPSRQVPQPARTGLKPIAWITPLTNFEYEDPIILEVIGGMASRCAEIGRQLMIVPTEVDSELDTYRELVAADQIGGFVVANSRSEGDRRVEFLLERGVPFVVYGRVALDRPYPWLDVAFAEAYAVATRHLLALGHRRIALMNSRPGYRLSAERERGYREALAEAGLKVGANWLLAGLKNEEFGYRTMQQLLHTVPAPTAVLCSSVITAKGAIFALNEQGLTVGKDVSLVAFDDNVAGTFYSVPLTTLFSPIRPLGRELVELLERAMAGEDYAGINYTTTPELVIRTSTGPVVEDEAVGSHRGRAG